MNVRSVDDGLATKPRFLVSIQQLRGIAASMVVFHHAAEGYPGVFAHRLNLGEAGVAVFFGISGFIIWTSSRAEAAGEFAWRRLVRIVPLYWLALLSVLAIGIHSWGQPIFAPAAIVKSALFIPYFVGPPTLTPFPVLVPGWTLNFEMFFYAVFAVGIAVRRPLLLPVTVMSAMFLAGQLLSFEAAPLVLYTKWLSILFVAGLLIGAADPRRIGARWLWPLGAVLVPIYNLTPAPAVVLGCGVTLLVGGIVAHERSIGWRDLKPLRMLGDASYAIYLFHMPALFVLGFVVKKMWPVELSWPVYTVLCMVLSWTVGLAAHYFVEKPLARKLRNIARLGQRRHASSDPTITNQGAK